MPRGPAAGLPPVPAYPGNSRMSVTAPCRKLEQHKTSGVRLDLREDAEARLAERQLMELGIHTPEVLLAALVAALDLDPAHRQRAPARPDGAELSVLLGLEHEREVDLDVKHLLHTADVGATELDERVEERAF